MNNEQRTSMRTLRRRREQLDRRLLNWEGTEVGMESAARERSALRWAIRMIDAADRLDVLADLEADSKERRIV